MWLYLLLLLGSVAVPLALSFDKKLHFYTQWRFVFPSIFIVAAFFILADVLLTRNGVWGFNPLYHSGISLLGLPLEEWLFFILIPYASIFLHESIILYFPKFELSQNVARIVTFALLSLSLLLFVFNLHKAYTAYIFGLTTLALLLAIVNGFTILCKFYLTFLVILIPFLLVNGVLTGSFIDGEVVWYNNDHNLGIRLFTIPIEDVAYGFSLIYLNLWLMAKLKTRNT